MFFAYSLMGLALLLGACLVCWILFIKAGTVLISFSKLALSAFIAYVCTQEIPVFSNGWANWFFFLVITGGIILGLSMLRYTGMSVNFFAALAVSDLVLMLITAITSFIVSVFGSDLLMESPYVNVFTTIISLGVAIKFAIDQDKAMIMDTTDRCPLLQILLASPVYGAALAIATEIALDKLTGREIFTIAGIVLAVTTVLAFVIQFFLICRKHAAEAE